MKGRTHEEVDSADHEVRGVSSRRGIGRIPLDVIDAFDTIFKN